MASMDNVISVEPRALTKLLAIRSAEPDAEDLGIVLTITGVNGAAFTYEMALMLVADAAPDDHVEMHGELPVIIPKADVEHLRGSVMAMSRDLLAPGLQLQNPNSPSPEILGSNSSLELSGEIADQVVQVVDTMINPAIASHGGQAEVVAVEEGTVYVRLGGGCQGCGMASVTLSSGIEATIRHHIPSIVKVVDVTDHSSGDNPYYEQAKK